jgi:hypothetical protein
VKGPVMSLLAGDRAGNPCKVAGCALESACRTLRGAWTARRVSVKTWVDPGVAGRGPSCLMSADPFRQIDGWQVAEILGSASGRSLRQGVIGIRGHSPSKPYSS